MLEAIFICEGVPFLAVRRLSVVSEDFQGNSLKHKQVSQAANDSTHGVRGHQK